MPELALEGREAGEVAFGEQPFEQRRGDRRVVAGGAAQLGLEAGAGRGAARPGGLGFVSRSGGRGLGERPSRGRLGGSGGVGYVLVGRGLGRGLGQPVKQRVHDELQEPLQVAPELALVADEERELGDAGEDPGQARVGEEAARGAVRLDRGQRRFEPVAAGELPKSEGEAFEEQRLEPAARGRLAVEIGEQGFEGLGVLARGEAAGRAEPVAARSATRAPCPRG